MIKWDVGYWKDKVVPIDIISETECFVTFLEEWRPGATKETRVKKEGRIFDSFDDAKEHIVTEARRIVGNAEASLQSKKAFLKKVNDIPKPV